MLRKSTDEFMEVAMPSKGGEAEEENASATGPIKEVNNNILGSRGGGEDDIPGGDSAMGAERPASPPPQPPPSSTAEMEAATVYSCGSLRLSVTAATPSTSAAQWLCVARLPKDFTRAELVELVEEYGPVEETHMIHSEKTGKRILRMGQRESGWKNNGP